MLTKPFIGYNLWLGNDGPNMSQSVTPSTKLDKLLVICPLLKHSIV